MSTSLPSGDATLHLLAYPGMSSRVAADLQRIDRAIRPAVSNRLSVLLKSGSVEAWDACLSSLQETTQIIFASSFADQNGSAAAWIHWRKSGTSKLLLGLLRAVVEDAPGSAVAACRLNECALHFGIRVINFMFRRTLFGALWPAMREWIFDQGGLQAIWQALAWSMGLVVNGSTAARDGALRVVFCAVIGLMFRSDDVGEQLSFPLSAHPGISAALTLLLSDLLPRDLASRNAHEWHMQKVLSHVVIIGDQLGSSQPQLHRAFLVSWPHFIGWLWQQHGVHTGSLDMENLMVRHGVRTGRRYHVFSSLA